MALLSISSLAFFFAGEQKSIDRGENHYQSDHIESFTYSTGVIRGQVHASMKDKSYKVTVYLDDNLKIKSTECECPRGEFKCSHAAAVFIYGIHNLSRTDVECQWKQKRNKEESKGTASEMFPMPEKKKHYMPLTRKPNQEDRSWLYDQLRNYGKFTGVCWLLSPEPQPSAQLPIKTIEEIIYSEDFLSEATPQQQLAYVIENAKVGQSTILAVSNLTAGQRTCPAWHQARRGRLTASNFGAVLNAKRATPALIKRLLGEYDLSGVRAISWGVDNEELAVKSFVQSTGLEVVQTGLWLEQSGILGASPDGLIGEDSVLEVKCPYTYRNSTIAGATENNTFCLVSSENGQLTLRKNHNYWHQIQGQMFLTGRHWCYFTVWTTKDVVVLKIQRDESWKANIDTLTDFYYHHIFPKIIEGEL